MLSSLGKIGSVKNKLMNFIARVCSGEIIKDVLQQSQRHRDSLTFHLYSLMSNVSPIQLQHKASAILASPQQHSVVNFMATYGFTFLVPAHLDSPRKRAVKRVFVYGHPRAFGDCSKFTMLSTANTCKASVIYLITKSRKNSVWA